MKLYCRQFFITKKLELQGSFVVKDPDPGPRDPKKPYPTGSGSRSTTLVCTNLAINEKWDDLAALSVKLFPPWLPILAEFFQDTL